MPEPLAVVGIGCRFPGGVTSPGAFWNLLTRGVDAITDMPADRFDLARLFSEDPSRPGTMYTRWGGFLDRIDEFDSGFFGISPREAIRIDPQQRLLLETSWEALEDAGIAPDRLAGMDVGVFVGISTHDYGDVQMYPVNRELLDHHSNTGSTVSIAANRISYAFDFRGPSLTVDTACSSALTAIHLACSSLRAAECRIALVGGVQVLLTPEPTMGFCRATMLSPTGRCRAFDARADGYVRSEGVGMVVIRPLAEAIAGGDPIYAVILGSAVNQDGRTTGMTVPSGAAQTTMLRRALANAGVRPRDVQYVEAHGTGTPVGDPIEAAAIGAVFGGDGAPDVPCAIGSVKTNIGHLEAASGIAGFIKTTLALAHRELPPSLHFERPNPEIDLDALRLRVVTTLERWPASAGKAIAGVNGFGFGGANAHVVLGEAPLESSRRPSRAVVTATATADGEASSVAQLLAISARSDLSLIALARKYLELLTSSPALSLRDLCAAAAIRRAHHSHRLAVVGTTHEEIVDGLDAFLAGETRANVVAGRAASPAPRLAFVFSGMGPQWWGMARQLLEREPLVRAVIERCDQTLRSCADWSLLETLLADESSTRIADADRAQLTGLAVQIALVELWKSWGIVPDAVIGHSAGEMGAAYTAGVHDLEDSVRLAYHRGRLQARATGQGRMLAAGIALDEIAPWLEQHRGHVSVAAVNGPASLTLSGDPALLDALMLELQQSQKFARFLPVSVPYHSARMDPIRDELITSLRDLQTCRAEVPLVSEVTGGWTDGLDFNPDYWWRNVREPVQFAAGMRTLISDGFRLFLEVGPHPVLAASVSECLGAEGVSGAVLASLRRMEDDRTMLLRSMAGLYVQGRPIDWQAFYPGSVPNVDLPTYCWDRTRYWFEPKKESRWQSSATLEEGSHPLLTRRLPAAVAGWETALSGARLAYMDEHRVQGTVVFPGAGFVEIALAAANTLKPDSNISLTRLDFRKALFIAPDDHRRIQIVFDRHQTGFEIFGNRSDGEADEWTLHASGHLAAQTFSAPIRDLRAMRARCSEPVSREACYDDFARRGLDYGPTFRGIQEAWRTEANNEALGRISMPDESPHGGSYYVHPAMLDAALQLLFVAAPASGTGDAALYLPVRIEEVRFHKRPGSTCWAHVRILDSNSAHVVGTVELLDEDGGVAIEVRGLSCQRVADRASGARETIDDWLYDYQWQPLSLETAPVLSPDGTGVFGSDRVSGLARLQQGIDERSRRSGWHAYYLDVEPRLDDLAVAYIVLALEELGFGLEEGDRITWSEIAARISPSRERLARRLLAILTERGILEVAGSDWIVLTSPTIDLDPLRATSVVETRAYGTEIALIARCGTHLSRNLAGSVSATETLFSAEVVELLQRFYREAPPSHFYNAVMADALSALDSASPLRILEIGAGTGGATASMLTSLEGRRSEYTFTDISPVFVERAAARWRDRPGFSARVFDLEVDAIRQGMPSHAWDVIVAANVVHATADVAASLARIRTLLAPGGVLLLLEITRRPLWLDVIFGLTDGWWRFEDRHVRPDHALLGAAQWEGMLRSAGFDTLARLADREHSGEAGQTVFAAREPVETHHVPAVAPTGRWLIFADRKGVASALARSLQMQGSPCTLVEVGVSLAGEDVDRLFAPAADEDLPLLGVVHLWSLDLTPPEGDSTEWLTAQAKGSADLVSIAQACARTTGGRTSKRPTFWLVTAGGQPFMADATVSAVALEQASVWGIGRVLMKEQTDLRCRLIDLDKDFEPADIETLTRQLTSDTDEEEVAIRGGRRFVRRLTRVATDSVPLRSERAGDKPSSEWRAEIQTPGALQTIGFRSMASARPGRGEVGIRIESASVNFRDVMLAMGTIPGLESESSFGHQYLGLDAAGYITACGEDVTTCAPGDAVVAIVPGAFASSSVTSAHLVARRPSSISVEQAAAVPCAFVTADYTLNHLARLASGERVLIHAGTGGVGLAAIQIAQRAGATVFATAGNAEKRAWLTSIGVSHVMDSRSLAFSDEILDLTAGEGVDVVLNSLAGEALVRSLALLRPYGRFLEIGKRDIYQDSQLSLLAFRKNLSFFAVDLDRLCAERPQFVGQLLRDVMKRFADGTYEPLPQTVFPMTEVEDALRLMAQARHIGKVVVSSAGSPPPTVLSQSEELLFQEQATYLITGGLGGFGLAVARWLCAHGARHLVLMGRRPASEDQAAVLAELEAAGGNIDVFVGDVGRASDVRSVIQTIRSSGHPLRGVFHLAMVLDDAVLSEMNAERFARVMAPKMAGAWNLHVETSDEDLDHFVLFSSIASLLGNPMQANYGAANAFLDALACVRRQEGRRALTVNWGVLSDLGYVSRHRDVAEYLERQGYGSFTPEEALDVLAWLMKHDVAQMMAARIDWPRWAGSTALASVSPRLRHLVPAGHRSNAATGATQRKIIDELRSIGEASAREEWLAQFLRQKVAMVLGASPIKIDVDRPLTELGTDSLTAVELTTVLKVDLGVELPLVKVLQGVSTRRLAVLVLELLNLEPVREGRDPTAPAAEADRRAADVAGTRIDDVADKAPDVAVPPAVVEQAPARAVPKGVASSGRNGHHNGTWSHVQRVARGSLALAFRTLTSVRIEGLEHVPTSGPCVLAVNHLSMMDVPLAFVVLPRPAVMLAADYLQRSRVVDWLLGDLGHAIYVERGTADRTALDRAVEVLRGGGVLALAPEGTRSKTGALGHGRTGAAYLATETGAPIVPLVAWGQERMGRSWRRFQRAPIHVRIGRPLYFPKGRAPASRLREYADSVMHALAAELPLEYRGVYTDRAQDPGQPGDNRLL